MSQSTQMEERLNSLVVANGEEHRKSRAADWKKDGGKIIGIVSAGVPEEIILAAGMLPWRVTGSWNPRLPLASEYRPTSTGQYSSHVLEAFLSGQLDFLDGIVMTDWEQDGIRLWDVLVELNKVPFVHIMHVPHQLSGLAYRMMASEIKAVSGLLEDFSGVRIAVDALFQAIGVCNETRTLLADVYELRKRAVTPLSGAEALGLTTAATIIPKNEFNEELRAILPYLNERVTKLGKVQPRILVSSDMLDNPAFLELIEAAGCVVAMDDLDTGSRYFWGLVDTGLDDPFQALAERYLNRPASPYVYTWERQVAQIMEWANEFRVDGVLELPEMYSFARQFRAPLLARRLASAQIPYLAVNRDYAFSLTGQLQNRVDAFVEMIDSRAGIQ